MQRLWQLRAHWAQGASAFARSSLVGAAGLGSTTRATHSWVRWPLNTPHGTGKGSSTDLLGGHSFEVISHPWFVSPAPNQDQHPPAHSLFHPTLSQVCRHFCTSGAAPALQGFFWNVYEGRVTSPSLQDGRCMCLHGPLSPGGSVPWFLRREWETIATKCLRQSK